MVIVIFEVTPKASGVDAYFATAAALKQYLSQIDGFISVERFQSVTNPERFLSLSVWRDEDAVKDWREQPEHQQAQETGKNALFAHYRIRVAQVLRDYEMEH